MSKCTDIQWVQKDGTPIRVRDMSDKHLLSTIRLLRRWSKAFADNENRSSQAGVWDADDAKGLYFFEDECLLEGHPTWPTLQLERKMRGLEELGV